jgi:ATP-dependent Clp protease ATP-binding subunit ClpA
MKKIVGKFLQELNTMTIEKGVEVNANEEAVEFLIEKGFDAKLGARPLARIIDNEIKKPLSRMILFGELQDGGRVEVTVKDKKLAIDYKKPVVIEKQKTKKVNEKTS